MELVTTHRVSDPRAAWDQGFLGRLSGGSHLLDLGCGPGVPTAAEFVRNGHRVTRIDVSPRQVELARVNVPQGRFLIGDALTTNFPTGSFDAIAALFVLTHIPRAQWASLFARFVEWLSPQGWLQATFGMNDSSGWDEEDFLGFGHTNWTDGFGPENGRRLLVDAGFRIDRAETIVDELPSGVARWLWVIAHAGHSPELKWQQTGKQPI